MLYKVNTPFVLDLTLSEKFLFEVPSVSETLPSWLMFAFYLFFAGVLGMIFNYKNFLVTMMSVELMYLGVVTSFILHSSVCHDSRSAVYGLVLLVLAACESAIGLGILIVLYRFGHSIDFAAYQNLGG
jgi:NADH-quinone oxidoreductase subunit K